MAQYSGVHVAYVGNAASVGADLVVLSGAGSSIKVTNVNGAGTLWWTVSHPGGSCPVPTVGGTNCYVTAPAANAATNVRTDGQFGSVVQVVASAASVSYMIEVQSSHATS